MNLINTKEQTPGLNAYSWEAVESRAYYGLNPYPFFGFQNWKTEELGQYPKCHPFPQSIIRKSAIWLFGKHITWEFPQAKEVEKALLREWRLNKFDYKLVNLATKAGTEGEISLKFSYDPSKDVPVRFQILSNVDHVRYYYSPLDADEVMMVRIQFPYFNYEDGNWYYYREEWTKEFEVHYHPIKINRYGPSAKNPYLYTGDPSYKELDEQALWKISLQKENPFGIIPIVKIKNIERDGVFGKGDLFGLTRVIDRINLAYYLADRSLQKNIDPMLAFIDLIPAEGDSMDRPQQPGGAVALESIVDENGEARKGQVVAVETEGKILEYLDRYAQELKNMLFDATGSVFPRQADVTNKGKMTQSVLIQLYAPLLEMTNEKRKSYGELGLGVFLKTVIIGLKNAGVKPYSKLRSVDSLFDDKLTVNFTWFSQFEHTEDEKFAAFDRLDREAQGGYMPVEDVVRRIAQIEEIKLTEEEVKEQVNKVNEQIEFNRNAANDKGRGNDPTGVARAKENQSTEEDKGPGKQQGRGPTVKDAT